MDPQEEEVLPPDKQGEGEISEHQEQLDEHMEPQYQWDTEEEEETDNNTVFLQNQCNKNCIGPRRESNDQNNGCVSEDNGFK